MHIACDLDGGDRAPSIVIKGVDLAARKWPQLKITLLGHANDKALLTLPKNVFFNQVAEPILADDSPLKAIKAKQGSSIVTGCKMLKAGDADLFISAGNTGALIAAGLLYTGKMPGVDRPALAPLFPTISGGRILVLDVGANPEAKPEHLLQYAQLGNLFVKYMFQLERPRVGLINIGTEMHKGTAKVQEAFSLLSDAPELNFVGNIEARDVLRGPCDVLVCDGFSGNILLKTTEGVALSMFSLLKEEFSASLPSKLAAAVLKPKLRRIKQLMDYRQYGGVPLLGLSGAIFKAHGSSDEAAFCNAIGQAKRYLESQLHQRMIEALD